MSRLLLLICVLIAFGCGDKEVDKCNVPDPHP